MLSDEQTRASSRSINSERTSMADWFFVVSIFPALAVLLLAMVPLFGHWLPQSGIFSAIPLVKGTHPMTSIMAILLSVSLLLPLEGRWTGHVARLLAGLCLLLAAGRFVPQLSSVYELSQHNVKTGYNSAMVFLILSLARIGLEGERPSLGQFATFTAPVILFPALIGYIFGDDGLYGYMSLATALMAGGLILGLLCRRATTGLVASLFLMDMFRVDLALGVIAPVFVGLGLVYFMGYGPYRQIVAVVIAHTVALNVLIQIVGMHRSSAIERRRRELEEQRLWDIVTDEVTGLYNRGALRQRFSEMADEARETRAALSIVVLDLDGFDRVNALSGFEHGDKVLRDVAQAILPLMRDDDFIGRAHADEFLIFLPGLRAAEVAVIARRLCKAVRMLGHQTEDGPLTASAGVARWHFSETSKQLYERALAALEVARIRGGDQACVAPGPDGTNAVWRTVEDAPVAGWTPVTPSPGSGAEDGAPMPEQGKSTLDQWQLPEFSDLSQVRLASAKPGE
ncbi:GGDEF domain-containing protein [Thioclava sp. GXIMD2076]|uniref:diguanylate cyclase n=1 Tax=Thioclava kandeliae TaxID=3070818 RepID=A0ABV1SCP5_9RHOB